MLALIKRHLRLPWKLKTTILVAAAALLGLTTTGILVYATHQTPQETTGQNLEAAKEEKQTSENAVKKQEKEKVPGETGIIEDASSAGSSTSERGVDTGTIPPSTLHLPTGPLHMSRSAVALPQNGLSENVDVWAGDGLELADPQITASAGIDVFVSSSVGGRWNLSIKQSNLNSSGQGVIKVSTNSFNPSKIYSGDITVTWQARPNLYVKIGSLTKVVGATTITYTANFTLVPSGNFGSPTINAKLYGGHCTSGETNKTFTYNGQNQHQLTCIVDKQSAHPFSMDLSISAQGSNGYIPTSVSDSWWTY